MAATLFKPPRFAVNDLVTVTDIGKTGHVRTQNFIRGETGTVVEYCGTYLNPEDLAVGRTSGPAVHLYRVAFDMQTLWTSPPQKEGDQLITEVYEHWLEPALC